MSSKKKSDILLFEYGSLCHDKIIGIVGDVDGSRGAILPRHEIRFGGHSKTYGGSGVATAVPSSKKDIIGVVYKIKEAQLELLDLVFECHLGLMKRVETIVDDGKRTLSVYMYVLQATNPIPTPVSDVYKELHKTLVREGFELFRRQNFTNESETENDKGVHRKGTSKRV